MKKNKKQNKNSINIVRINYKSAAIQRNTNNVKCANTLGYLHYFVLRIIIIIS